MSTIVTSVLTIAVPLLAAPLLAGVINKTKAFFAGRKGRPLLQLYYDIIKLFKKDFIYSKTTSWIFRAGPQVGMASMIIVLGIMPLPGMRAPFAFDGDFLLLFYLLGLVRFFTVLAALDTGSSFEGMGASREVLFSALTEPVVFFILSSLVFISKNYSLSSVLLNIDPFTAGRVAPEIIILGIAFFIIMLAENSRIPFDDPDTHLELTMIHEVMVLDYGSADLGLILYGASLKLWVFGILLVQMILPVFTDNIIISMAAALGGMLALAVLIGIIESVMARLRLLKAPLLIAGAGIVSVIVFILLLVR
jgi:formate hydrogenlyase subunit 4